MKKIILIICFASFIFYSCDESFSPKGEFENGYSVFCIIDGNTNIQTAYVTKNYNPEGLNPTNFTEAKSIAGANIKLTTPSTVYNFKDTILISSASGENYNSYYLENFNNTINELKLNVLMQNGTELNSSLIPANEKIRLGYETARDIRYDTKSFYKIIFDTRDKPFYFMTSLYINYIFKQANDTVEKRIEVPVAINYLGNDVEFIYPDLIYNDGESYPIIMIKKTLERIAEEHPNSTGISIKDVTLEVLEVTEELANYYILNRSFENGYSIKAQRPAYSNIEGGNGLFGYKYLHTFNIKLHPDWQQTILNLGFSFS